MIAKPRTRKPTVLAIVMLGLAGLAAWQFSAAQQQAMVTPNYEDADIRKIIEAVGLLTGKSFIIDPRVNAKVTILSSTPMSPEAFY